MAELLGLTDGTITLASSLGPRIGLEGTWPGVPLRSTQYLDDEWERFRLVASGKNLYALQTLAISPPVYLSAGADGTVRTEAQAISAAEEFDLVPLPKGHVALRTHTGTYLGAVNGGGGEVRCDFKDISPETTLLIRVMNEDGTFSVPGSAPSSDPVQQEEVLITLACKAGPRVGLDGNWPGVPLRCTQDFDDDWETFRVFKSADNNTVALQCYGISTPWVYLTVTDTGDLKTEEQQVTAAEHFQIVALDDAGHVALRTHTGMYMGAVNGGGGEVRCDFKDINPETTLLLKRKIDGVWTPVEALKGLPTSPHTLSTMPPLPAVPAAASVAPAVAAQPQQPAAPLQPALINPTPPPPAPVPAPVPVATAAVPAAAPAPATQPSNALVPGVLTVTVEFGHELKDKDWFTKQDPYAIVTVGSQTFRTRTIQSGGKSPVFNETFKYNIITENTFSLVLKDEDLISDEFIGHGTGDLSRVRQTGADRQQVPMLSKKSGKQHGFVCVSLQFTPNA